MPVDQAPRTRPGRPEQQLLKRRFTARTLPQLRLRVEECAACAGLPEPQRGGFVLAVDEVLTNAVEHAGGEGRLLLRRVGDELEAQVSDAGPGFSADVIPELLPGLDGGHRGRGLWLARLTTDRLRIAPAHPGSVVTLAVALPPGPVALFRPAP
ncbi:ATP-binding protein [Streptomyces sp. TRM 70351]|uniref:ATP-binding protein n=1 Tax=Streptomyces sp. TRM 70351 TaxID=3116552 RepID=UPI002E7AC634|nr:ATP-binding protein [Streptomyces sp. TRM 70351]MEE1929906.1 ATP-binding protein [Streptomyces sp. TRM 70351]